MRSVTVKKKIRKIKIVLEKQAGAGYMVWNVLLNDRGWLQKTQYSFKVIYFLTHDSRCMPQSLLRLYDGIPFFGTSVCG